MRLTYDRVCQQVQVLELVQFFAGPGVAALKKSGKSPPSACFTFFVLKFLTPPVLPDKPCDTGAIALQHGIEDNVARHTDKRLTI